MLEAHGTARAPGFPGGSHREKLLARRGTAAAHAARRLAGFAAAGSGAGRETDRPFRERSGVDRRRAHSAGLRAALRKSAPRDGELTGRAARKSTRLNSSHLGISYA